MHDATSCDNWFYNRAPANPFGESLQHINLLTSSLFQFLYVAISDCYTIASDYRGTIAKTVEGIVCQKWSENFPQEHGFHDNKMFSDEWVTAALNYCRSPDNGTVPWCYTNDSNVRWDYCDVPICNGTCALTYIGPFLIIVIPCFIARTHCLK